MKEGKNRHRAAFWVFGMGGVLITAAIIALYTPWLPIFDLRQVSIVGNQRVSASAIVQVSDLSRGTSLPSISLRGTAARIASLPWVKSAHVHREYPHGLRIQITERMPIARVSTGGDQCSLLAEGGIFVSGSCDEWDELVLVSGATLANTMPGARIPEGGLTELVEGLRAAAVPGLSVRKLDASDAESIELIDASGTRVRLGALSVAAARIRFLEALCHEVNVGNYELIDLRFGGEATLVPRVRR